MSEGAKSLALTATQPGLVPLAEPHCSVPRANVLGVGVSALNMPLALRIIHDSVRTGARGYICCSDVNAVMEAQRDPAFRRILNHSLLTTPDGMPTVWVGKWQGFRDMSRVYGPDLMSAVCESSVALGHTHFLYGGAPGIAERLRDRLVTRYPGINIVGTYTPPFRSLTDAEADELCRRISELRPNYFWVGISTPKQDRFMAEFIHRLDVNLMIGVGAAFDFHAGVRREPPAWVQNSGFQWIHRLVQEPGRLGKRYLRNNPAFLLKIFTQVARLKKFDLNC